VQQDKLIHKICACIEKVNHQDIGNLALVTFQLANCNQIILPLLALDKYFFKLRYRFVLSEYESAQDEEMIEETSSEGLVQAEETTIYHFQNVAEFTTIERNISTALKVKKVSHSFLFIHVSFFIVIIIITGSRVHAKLYSVSLPRNHPRFNCKDIVDCAGRFSLKSVHHFAADEASIQIQ
jgi:hypothetical protein